MRQQIVPQQPASGRRASSTRPCHAPPRFWAALAVAGALALAGCNGGGAPGGTSSSSAKTEISFWHTQTADNSKALQSLVDLYNQTNHKGILVNATYQGNYSDLNRKTVAAIQAHDAPNVAVAYESMVGDYMAAHAVAPLDPFIKGPNGMSAADLGDIFPAYIAINRYPSFGNQLLSFPFTKSLAVMYYNVNALKEAGFAAPPATWPEFRRAALAAAKKDATGKPLRYGLDVDLDASTVDAWFYSNGVSLLSPDNHSVRFNSPGALEVLTTLRDIFAAGAGLENPPQSYDYESQFGGGRVALFCGSSTVRTFIRAGVAGKFPWAVASIPQKDPTHPATVLYGGNLCIFRSTPAKEAASWDFVKWLTEPAQVAFWSTHSSYMPIRKSVAAMPQVQAAWKQDPQGQQCFKLIPAGRGEPFVRGWQDVRRVLTNMEQTVISGRSTPAAALSDAASQANAALARYR